MHTVAAHIRGVIFWLPIQNYLVVSYHGLKANGSQLGNLLHDKICFMDKMDLLSLVPESKPCRVRNNDNN